MSPIEQWTVKHSELALDTKWARVRKDACILPDGSEVSDYYYWEGGDYAQVFAITKDNHVILTKQYKHGVKEIVIELPAGLVDPRDPSPFNTAKRELLEETGYTSQDWHPLGVLNVSSAKSTARAHIFLANGIVWTESQKLDKNENIEIAMHPLSDVMQMIRMNELRDAGSIAACLLALQVLNIRSFSVV